MRAGGKLGKKERLRDEWGRVRGEKLLDALEFMQKDIPRFYGAQSADDTIDRVARTGMMSAPGIAGLMKLNIPEMRKAAAAGVTAEDTTGQFLGTAAGFRTLADVKKDVRDIGLGESLIGAQDKAVGLGGGAAGIALGSASQIFNQGAQTFWNAVEIFAGSVGARGAAGAASGAVGAAVSSGVAGKVIGALGVPGMAAAGLTMSGDVPERYRQPASEDANTAAIHQAISMNERHLADVRKGGIGGWFAETLGGGGERETEARISQLKAELAGSGKNASDAKANADELDKVLSKRTLRVQVVQSLAPPGKGQEL
jgi:hypothetical protein